ncbi:MAG TPA: DNA methyltransferase [Parafilimonas sp.]|nr:DNA methyltransferase [Parafilimonas sp.]
MTKPQFKKYIENFNFVALFNNLGWNYINEVSSIKTNVGKFSLSSIAEKSGFRILCCQPDEHGNVPTYLIRLKIENQISKLFREHLIIFIDANHSVQIWQTLVKKGGDTKLSSTIWHAGQEPELLYQKASGLIFTLDEEENITIVDVTERVWENFNKNIEDVTKNFYKGFEREHGAFIHFIKGIKDKVDKDWYASLMLNRLMFCYFIQKKRFLDNNLNYLAEKLESYKKKKGHKSFYSFYRNFLLVLFHKGLNTPAQTKEVKDEIGTIPYLNGGLFDVHEIELKYKDLDIDDKAFEQIFSFFDKWNWHLDTRANSTQKDINPDVIGYIFEKYINDRAKMGAYYTKEDITDYISKNCIIPSLFSTVRRNYPIAVDDAGEIWQIMKESGDKYIYPALKKGINHKLPPDIEAGINIVSARTEWNRPSNEEYALPTELWRETEDRFSQYYNLKYKIESGQITSLSQFISHNLNIKLFTLDIIDNTSDPDFIRAFYKAITTITILDPTCGSGAFLFAAMNVLEPLYERCINRMRWFIEDEDNINKGNKRGFKNDFKDFRDILENIQGPQHPNLDYFIYKSIILCNLYGVDIMKEAVEIAKLRLFLKVVAIVDADYSKINLGLEPLPDIDFNIRSGNTLIGFATQNELQTGFLDYQNDKAKVSEELECVGLSFKKFKEIQLASTFDYAEFKVAKTDYELQLNRLKNKLDLSYYNTFGNHKLAFDEWKKLYQPFHWFSEYYEIVFDKGGFDVIIGNPPYLEAKQIEYQPNRLKTYETGAVHNMCIERSVEVLKKNGNISMIVPLALVCTQRMVIVQKILEGRGQVWYANFAWRPGKLFETVNRALTIFIALSSDSMEVQTTKYIRWQSHTRGNLFSTLNFVRWSEKKQSFWVPKLTNQVEVGILKKILTFRGTLSLYHAPKSTHRIYYRTTGGLYWKIFTNFSPKFFLAGKQSKSSRETFFPVQTEKQAVIFIALFSSNLFWWWYTVTSNLRDLNPSDLQGFKFPTAILEDDHLFGLGQKYLVDLDANSVMLTRIQKQTGETQTQSFKISLSKKIIDEIDLRLAKHFQLDAEELDFIINYDIKYRVSADAESEETNEDQLVIAPSSVRKINIGNTKNITPATFNFRNQTNENEPMKEFTLDEGIYSINDVVQITGITRSKTYRWFKDLSKEHYEGLNGVQQNEIEGLKISFHGLIELVVIDTLRANKFTLKKILKARADLKNKTGKVYPFATNNVRDNLKIAGKSLIFRFSSGDVTLDGSGQFNLRFIEEFFKNIEFDTEGIALRLFPYKNTKLIIVDPKQGGGKAVINGKGVWAESVAMIYVNSDSIPVIQEQYDLDRDEVLAAVEFCNT